MKWYRPAKLSAFGIILQAKALRDVLDWPSVICVKWYRPAKFPVFGIIEQANVLRVICTGILVNIMAR